MSSTKAAMSTRKNEKIKSEGFFNRHCSLLHCFNDIDNINEIKLIRKKLLSWFNANKRELPWRTIASRSTDIEDDVRGYSVWVSEIMLQQTQVATVVGYYNKWMKKWPTIAQLSKAELEDVHKVWSGLGYYSRATRLLEGARKIQETSQHFPQTARELQQILPGVGRYTASAIASIAYNERVGLVDGNVARVLSRLCRIGAAVESKIVTEALWHNANALVDDETPGDFNQAVMELGATVCTPKNPNCSSCPLSDHCLAFEEVKQLQEENKNKLMSIKSENWTSDIEDCISDCKLCLPKDEKYVEENGVTNYPRKGKKTSQREESSLVYILQCKTSQKYCLVQRPETGLLANLLEFPSVNLTNWSNDSKMTKSLAIQKLKEYFGLTTSTAQIESLGNVGHIFSHIRQTYIVYKIIMVESEYENINIEANKYQKIEWLSEKELKNSPISTAMKKVLKLDNATNSEAVQKSKIQVKRGHDGAIKNQKGIKSFFSVKSKT